MADNNFKIPIYHENFSLRENARETMDKVVAESGNSQYGLPINPDKTQLLSNNLIPSVSEHRISDGQKRYRTLGKTTSSNYPRPKTLFKVFFEPNKEMGVNDTMCDELTKYVLEVTKPNIQYTTKQMNQYNRIKYVYDNVKYGDLKITFIDVKDNPIQQTFFSYMMKNNNDIKNEVQKEWGYKEYFENDETGFSDADWGLNINSSKHMFNSITICEYFLNKIMVYKIENPTLKDINFGSNKIGDYNYNEISVTFAVEGITNILDYTINSYASLLAIDETISNAGGEALAHKLGMRWYEGLGNVSDPTLNNDYSNPQKEYAPINSNIEASNKKIESANRKLQEEQVRKATTDYSNYVEKTTYYWLPDDQNYSSGNALDALLGVVTSPQDISKIAAPRIKQLTDYFKF